MTKNQVWWLAGIGAAIIAVFAVVHGVLLPMDDGWRVSRIVHQVWLGVVVLAAGGGITWVFWPRGKPRRRDEERLRAQRRVISILAIAIAAVIVVVVGEVRRETSTRAFLAGAATADMQAIAKALDAYAADHGGKPPEDVTELTPQYLEPSRLYYVYRRGPLATQPPDDPTAEPPTFALAKEPPATEEKKKQQPNRITAYLRPGCAWAPMTVVLEKDGQIRITGEDAVRTFEKQAEQKRTDQKPAEKKPAAPAPEEKPAAPKP